ncbi:hypothetical protein IKS86_08085 [bacterium]|nr:hypothetical protein [bacterium]
MRSIIFSAFFLFCFCVFANGGPVFDNKLGSTGNVTFVKKAALQLVKEDLKIKVDGEKAHFQVRYTFQNIGGDTKIQFAFPMETRMFGWSCWGEKELECQANRAKEIKNFIEKEKVFDYKISKNGKDLKWSKKSETKKIEDNSDEDLNKISEWFISEIEFKKFEKAEIYISYTIESGRTLGFYSCSAMPEITSRDIHYNFYPASFFGTGSVGDLSVTVDLTELKKDNGKLDETRGLEFIEQNPGVLKFEGKNVDFKKVKEFLVYYSIEEKDRSDYIKAKRLLPTQFRIVSPNIAPENVEKMFDFDPETCFAPGKENEISFFFDKKSLPGYSAILLKTSKNDKFKVVGEMDCDTWDSEDVFEYTSDKIRKCDLCSASRCEMQKKPNCKFTTDCAYDLIDPGDYDPTNVKECRIKIKVEPVGATKNAPCISEIFIMPHYLGE